ncbi:MAG: hypothetical protein PHR83_08020 [Paludibacter sp.]|nr:hypothetical protein [Paludibacter sp.]
MVRTEANKLIIEIEIEGNYFNPAEELQEFQRALTEAIQFFNYKDFGEQNPCYRLVALLNATLPTLEQQKSLFNQPTH